MRHHVVLLSLQVVLLEQSVLLRLMVGQVRWLWRPQLLLMLLLLMVVVVVVTMGVEQ